VTLMEVASLPRMMKPDTGGEAMSSTRRTFRGGWGQRAGIDQSRNLGDPAGRGKGNRTPNGPREYITEERPWPGVGEAHTSEETG
jgi:hypothetical protein